MNEDFIKEIIIATISGEQHLGRNLKEKCLTYFDYLVSENQQLKQQLEQRDNIINKAKEYVEEYKKQWTLDDEVLKDMNYLLEILNIDKGE